MCVGDIWIMCVCHVYADIVDGACYVYMSEEFQREMLSKF